jgi:hypothetical protein
MENTVGPGPTQIQQRSINYKNKEMFKPFYQETLEQKQAKNREKRKKKKKEKVGENKKKKEKPSSRLTASKYIHLRRRRRKYITFIYCK